MAADPPSCNSSHGLLGVVQVGEFQCYDRRALASLAAAAEATGHSEWGYSGPHDAGDYNSNPEVLTHWPTDHTTSRPSFEVCLKQVVPFGEFCAVCCVNTHAW